MSLSDVADLSMSLSDVAVPINGDAEQVSRRDQKHLETEGRLAYARKGWPLASHSLRQQKEGNRPTEREVAGTIK